MWEFLPPHGSKNKNLFFLFSYLTFISLCICSSVSLLITSRIFALSSGVSACSSGPRSSEFCLWYFCCCCCILLLLSSSLSTFSIPLIHSETMAPPRQEEVEGASEGMEGRVTTILQKKIEF